MTAPKPRATMTKDSPATWIKAIAIWLFLVVWGSGLVTALAASSCRKDHKEPSRKLAACNISLTVGAPLDSGEHARAKRSFLHLERGIALAQLDRLPEAESALATAYRNAKGSSGPWLQNLRDRMASRPTDQAKRSGPRSPNTNNHNRPLPIAGQTLCQCRETCRDATTCVYRQVPSAKNTLPHL